MDTKISELLENFIPFKKGSVARKGIGADSKSIFTGMSVVYVIMHKKSGMIYVGSTTNAAARCTGHFNDLKLKVHKNKRLQDLYNDDKDIKILVKEIPKGNEIFEEQSLVNKLAPTGLLCNYGLIDVSRPGLGLKRSEEVIEKMRVGNTGKKRTLESREKMKLSHLGISLSDELKNKLSSVHKERLKTSKGKAAHARGISKISHKVVVDGVIYASKSEVSRKFNLHLCTVINRIRSKNFPGWTLLNKKA